MHTHAFVRITHGLLYPWYVISITMYNTHLYFPSEIWAKKCALYTGKYDIYLQESRIARDSRRPRRALFVIAPVFSELNDKRDFWSERQ